MARRVNSAGVSFANDAIRAGRVNKSASWSFEAADGNRLLGSGGNDWANYGRHHLAVNAEAKPETRERYSYPFAKGDTVYRSGLVAVRQRAAQQGDDAVFRAAGRLISEIDDKSSSASDNPEAWEYKSLPVRAEFKLAEGEGATTKGRFSGYLAAFNNMDDKGDVFLPGAFTRTLSEFKAAGNMPIMWINHAGIPFGAVSTFSLLPAGVWTHVEEDDKGLRAEGVLDPIDTDEGRKAYAAMKNGTLIGLSIGYSAKDYSFGEKPGDPLRVIRDATLFEGSIVTLPANNRALISSVSSSLIMRDIVATARETIDGDFDTRNIRHLEGLLREAGYSRSEAKRVATAGFKALDLPRDADVESAAQNLLDAVRAFRRSF